MSTITSLGAADNGSTSRGVINTNFTNLNTDKAEKNGTDAMAITIPDGEGVAALSLNNNDVSAFGPTLELITVGDQFFDPVIKFRNNHTEAAPADGNLARLRFYGNDSAGNETNFANFAVNISDNTNGSETGSVSLSRLISGTSRTIFSSSGTTNRVVLGGSHTDATVQSNGNNNLILQTGNATTGSITIVDGANGNIVLAPNGSGDVILGRVGGTGDIRPASNDAYALGASTDQWSDLYLAEGGVINWDSGDATLTQTGNVLALAGASLTMNADTMNLSTAKTPTSASDTGTTGDIAWDSNYVYVCVATNTWKRTALSTW